MKGNEKLVVGERVSEIVNDSDFGNFCEVIIVP